VQIFFDDRNYTRNIRNNPIEDVAVAMLPDGQGSQNKKGVKTFFNQVIHSGASGYPPLKEEKDHFLKIRFVRYQINCT
jgi:hypothetical protein